MRAGRLLWLMALTAGPLFAQQDTVLERHLAARVSASGLDAGVAVIDVASGARASVRGGRPYTMMSVYKFPIGLALLRGAARGTLDLDSAVVLRPDDRRPGPGAAPLSRRITPDGLRVSLRELLEATVVQSDNTASDALLRLLTPAGVNREISAIVPFGIRVDRQEGEMSLDYNGATLLAGEALTPEAISRAAARVPPERRVAAARAFPDDPRDTSTPLAMAELLVALSRGRALPPAQTTLLRGLMERTVTGPNRLRAGLPEAARLAHRTGTAGGGGEGMAAVNNVGLIAIPGHGDVAVAVFVRRAPEAAAERLIADLARIVWAHYHRGG